MSAWKEWILSGSDVSYREFCDECRRDEIRDREAMIDYYEYDEENEEEEDDE